MRASFRDAAVATALEIGLFDPDGLGSFTHPDRARLIYGDGKVVKPLSKYAPGETWVDRRTGEVKPRRADPDAAWYIVGGNEEPRGTKSVDATKPERPTKRGKQVRGLKTSFVMGRSPDPHGRVLLDFDHCPKDEMGFALASVAQMAPQAPRPSGPGLGRRRPWDPCQPARPGTRYPSHQPRHPGPGRPHHRQGRRLQASAYRHGER
jgi:hypothetical protein